MEVAFVHEVGADFLPVAVGEQDVVREDDRRAGASAGVQAPVDVLEEVELLVAGGEGEVVAGGALAALLRAERRIGQHKVVILHGLAQVGEGVAQEDLPADVVQHGVHEGQSVGVVHEFAAGKGLVPLEPRGVGVQVEKVPGLLLHVGVGRNHKAERPACRVVTPLPRLRLHQPRHDANQRPRREILPRARLLLVGVLLQQAFVEVAEALFFRGEPV